MAIHISKFISFYIIIFKNWYIIGVLKGNFSHTEQHEFIEPVNGQTDLTDQNGYIHRIITYTYTLHTYTGSLNHKLRKMYTIDTSDAPKESTTDYWSKIHF